MGKNTEKFSYSKLETYESCPFKYKLKYVDGNYVNTGNVATDIGTAIHSCEEDIARALQASEAVDYVSLKNNLIGIQYVLRNKYPKTYFEPDKVDRTYYEKVYYYLSNSVYDLEKYMTEHPTYKIVGIEQKFEIEYQGKTLRGFIDRVFFDTATNKYIIQDIKTYSVEVSKQDLATPLQFVIYALAAAELYNCSLDDIVCQYYLPFCSLTQDAGTTNYITRGKNKLEKIFTGIDSCEFKPKPSPLCHWCEYCPTNPNALEEYKYLCPYFSHWTKEHKTFAVETHIDETWNANEKHKEIYENYIKSIEEGKRLLENSNIKLAKLNNAETSN